MLPRNDTRFEAKWRLSGDFRILPTAPRNLYLWLRGAIFVAERSSIKGTTPYAMRKETIVRVFADAKETHGMRYTHHRGLARVTNWVRPKFAAMNLKKLAVWAWKRFNYSCFFVVFVPDHVYSRVFA